VLKRRVTWKPDDGKGGGTKHRLDERLDDHPNGRCTPVPWTKTWEELGIEGVPDSRPKIKDGQALFDKLPPEQKLKVLGPAKYMAYREGKITLSDLVGRGHSKLWGSMRYERSLKDLGLSQIDLLGKYRDYIATQFPEMVIGGVRVPQERIRHFLTNHPEVTRTAIENILEKAILNPISEQPSKKDKYAIMKYTQDDHLKWWVVVITDPPNSTPFALSFRRAHNKGK
jgi:hypothetical protein